MSKIRWDRAGIVIALSIGIIGITGCQTDSKDTTLQTTVEEASEAVTVSHIPEFTDIKFETSEAEMLKKEGEPSETYPSLYGGTVYVFPGHEFKGVSGSVKVMTDDDGNIASLSWLYESDDVDSVAEVYSNLHDELNEKFDNSGDSVAGQGSIGDAWNFDDVHIMIDAVITSDYKGMQVTYLKSEYSKKDIVDQKKKEREEQQ